MSFDFDDHSVKFNPVTGLPMVSDAVDVRGNAYGTDNMDRAFESLTDTTTHDTPSFSSGHSFGSDFGNNFGGHDGF